MNSYLNFYHKDLQSCNISDVNECISQELNACTDVCINLYGNFTCSCDQNGYSLSRDGVTCERKLTANKLLMQSPDIITSVKQTIR